jgi:methylated-DNA-[protein]-cysteine S-methyltransferase
MTRSILTRAPSPIGPLFLAVEEGRLRGLSIADHAEALPAAFARRHGLPPDAADERPVPGITDRLAAYWAGDLAALDAIPVAPEGTPFQMEVWAALRRIPAGRTWSYAELARAVGRPAATRAVGAANGQNPISLVVPCHRVITTGGGLGGYSGGLERKRRLLAHEGVFIPAQQALPST